MKTLIATEQPEILAALFHVRATHPGVMSVTYDQYARWLYKNSDGSAPSFGDIDIGLLEDAQDAAICKYTLPICFRLP